MRPDWDQADGGLPHRTTWAIVKLGVGFVVVVCSLYLIVSEGLTAGNLQLLAEVGARVQAPPAQTIIGGDWNMPPQQVAGSGLLERT
eukprot:3983020-Lingulodinium_polyedra.AAC.1